MDTLERVEGIQPPNPAAPPRSSQVERRPAEATNRREIERPAQGQTATDYGRLPHWTIGPRR